MGSLELIRWNVQSLENKMDDLRARTSFQRDIRDCNILCLSETWLSPSVLDTAVTPSDNFAVLRMDRTAEAGKIKGGGVCFMINKKWCDPRNISILSRSCSPHLEHLSIICRPFYLPPRVLRGHRYCRLHSTSGRHELGFVQTPRRAQRLHQQTPWRCLYHSGGL